MCNWDLSKMYKDKNAIEKDIKLVNENINKIDELKKNEKDNFVEILNLLFETDRVMDNLYTYASMKKDENSKVSESVKLELELSSLYNKLQSRFSFVEPFVLSLNSDEQDKLIKENPSYEIFFKKILRFKEHTLSAEEENIISLMSEAMSSPHNDFYSLQNTDMEFPYVESIDEKLTNANFVPLLSKLPREQRKEVFEKYYDELAKYNNTFGSTLYANIKNLVILSKIKKYDSARQMELFNDDVEEVVYDNLIDIVHEYLPYLYKYYDARKKLLGLDENHMYDVYVPSTKGFDREIPFEEAKKMVIEAVKPMGEEYQSIMKKAFEENWIDVYPKDGKKPGAYSWGSYDSYPYILLNYTNDVDSVFTLIHELGHSIHSYYSRANNEFKYAGYTIFVAEVASTCNEMLLLDYMIKNAKNDDEKLYLLDHHINSFKSTIFRQTMFAEFERETHKLVEEEKALTGEDFNEIYLNLNKKYFGDSVVSDDLIKYEWSRIPHFYTNFYVYKYATGLSSSSILSQKILSGNEQDLENYKNFLKDGNKNYPLVQLKNAGANIKDKEVLRTAFEVFKEKVLEFEEIVNK
ncbi:MAG: oligoendopeptidase F [Finegoldia magna]|nr:oligoendopeptidase F [Finegoldia magna]